MTDTLKPCPFCGNRETLEVMKPPEREGYVRCFRCGAVAQTVNNWNCRVALGAPPKEQSGEGKE